MTISLPVPQYLKQWAITENGGFEPIRFPKGSPFSTMITLFIRNKREAECVLQESPDDLNVYVPASKGKDPAYYNYMPNKSKKAIVELLRDTFDAQLFAELVAPGNIGIKQKAVIEAWMDLKGIDDTETNFLAVSKRLQLVRARYLDKVRKKEAYRKIKKIRENGNV